MKEENIVKLTCKELGITQKELAEHIGYSLPAVKKAVADNNVSEPMRQAILLYVDNLKLKEKLEDFNTITQILKKHL